MFFAYERSLQRAVSFGAKTIKALTIVKPTPSSRWHPTGFALALEDRGAAVAPLEIRRLIREMSIARCGERSPISSPKLVAGSKFLVT
jgi:hypothetical protein